MAAYSDIFLWAAAGLSLIGLLAHELAGGPMVLPPLAKSEMPATIISLHRFSWHVGSIAVTAMVAMFVSAALLPGQMPMAIIASAMGAGFTLLAVGLAAGMGGSGNAGLWKTPAPYIWALVALTGSAGVMTSGESIL